MLAEGVTDCLADAGIAYTGREAERHNPYDTYCFVLAGIARSYFVHLHRFPRPFGPEVLTGLPGTILGLRDWTPPRQRDLV